MNQRDCVAWEVYGFKPERWMLKATTGDLSGFMLAIIVRQLIGWTWRTSWGGRGRWVLTKRAAQQAAERHIEVYVPGKANAP